MTKRNMVTVQIEVRQGKAGRWRWYAYDDATKELYAMGPPHGFDRSADSAFHASMVLTDPDWVISTIDMSSEDEETDDGAAG